MRDFSLKNLKGKTVGIKDYKGKVVLLTFWATYCGPCRTELPQLQLIWDKYRDQGFELVSVNTDPADTESAVRQDVRRQRYRFEVLLDQETEVVNRYNPTTDLPFSLLIDRAGSISYIHQGYHIGDESIIEDKIANLLKD